MATLAPGTPPPRRTHPFAPDRFERALAAGAVVLLAAALAAILRGRTHWAAVPAPVWAHLATILVALALTPTMLLRPRGDRLHRRLGRVWAGAMLLTAGLSFLVHTSRPGGYSVVHILSAAVLLLVPRLVWTARAHDVRAHRRAVRAIVLGALLIAGFFTFPFHRMMGNWLFG